MAAREKPTAPSWRREGFGSRVYLLLVALVVTVLALHALEDAPRSWHIFGVSVADSARAIYAGSNRAYNWAKDAVFGITFAALFLAALAAAVLLLLKWPVALWKTQYRDWLARRHFARYGIVVVLLGVASWLFPRLAISLWFISPLAFNYNSIRLEYGEQCTVRVQDDSYGSSHSEGDWSRSPAFAGPSRARRTTNTHDPRGSLATHRSGRMGSKVA
jgi:hypothetical protein